MEVDTRTWTHGIGHTNMDSWMWTHGHDMDTWTWTHGPLTHGHGHEITFHFFCYEL